MVETKGWNALGSGGVEINGAAGDGITVCAGCEDATHKDCAAAGQGASPRVATGQIVIIKSRDGF